MDELPSGSKEDRGNNQYSDSASRTICGLPAISSDLADDSDYDSLFDDEDDVSISSQFATQTNGAASDKRTARRSAPPIPGLYFDPSILIPPDTAELLWTDCMDMFFCDRDVNQVMLFERARSTTKGNSNGFPDILEKPHISHLPKFLLDLLETLRELLKIVVPPDVHSLLFPDDDDSHKARQVILNHCRPGEGITPHVDLLKRYSDGIIGVSLHSGTVMDLAKVIDTNEPDVVYPDETAELSVTSTPAALYRSMSPHGSNVNVPETSPTSSSIYLPERSVFILSGEARYKWTHGISQRAEDLVESLDGNSVELLPRGERLSITFRWLLPGADIVGD